MDSRLSWTSHIDNIVGKVCKKIGVLRRSFRQLSCSAKRQFLLSVILPDLLYCCFTFMTQLSAKDRNRLSSLFRKSVRAACGAPFREDVLPLLKQLSLLPFEHYLVVAFAKFVHKNYIVNPLPCLTSLFKPYQSTTTSRTRSHSNRSLAVYKFRSSDGINSFSNRAALFFNALPVEWRTQPRRSHFAQQLHKPLSDPAVFRNLFDLLFGNVSSQ